MVVGVCQISLALPGVTSLKGKRSIVRKVLDRTANRFNVAVAEIGSNDKWQIGELGIVTVANETQFVQKVLQKVEDFLESTPSIRLIELEMEIL